MLSTETPSPSTKEQLPSLISEVVTDIPHTKEAVRQFTKEHTITERSSITNTIRTLRQEHFSRLAELRQKIETNKQQQSEYENELCETQTSINNLQVAIGSNQRNLLVKLTSTKRTLQLQAELATHETKVEGLQATLNALAQECDQLSILSEDKEKLEEAKIALEDFYDRSSLVYKEYLEDRHAAEVGVITKKYQVLVLHGVLLDRVPEANSIIKKETGWDEKIDAVLGLCPTICASTLRETDTSYKNYWSPVGLVLKKGTVHAATPYDGATKAGYGGRTVIHNRDQRVSTQIEKAVHDRHPETYNELVVSNPQPAALYIIEQDRSSYLDPDMEYIRSNRDAFYSKSRKTLLPLVIRIQNQWRQLTRFNPETGGMDDVHVPIDASDIPHLESGLTDEIIQDIEHRVLTNNMFNESKMGRNQELQVAIDSFSGFERYLVICREELGRNAPITEEWTIEETKKEMHQIYEHTRFGETKRFFVAFEPEWGPVVYERTENDSTYHSIPSERLRFKIGIGFSHDSSITSVDLIEAITTAITENAEMISRCLSDHEVPRETREQWAYEYQKRIPSLAAALHGFADAAEHFQDVDIARMAREAADPYLSTEEYQRILARRCNDKGDLVLYKEDFTTSSTTQ